MLDLLLILALIAGWFVVDAWRGRRRTHDRLGFFVWIGYPIAVIAFLIWRAVD